MIKLQKLGVLKNFTNNNLLNDKSVAIDIIKVNMFKFLTKDNVKKIKPGI